jgi:glycosyltransferase involved in cell wall biosynthesis
MVLLIGNYPADRQQSMQRFGRMMLAGLTRAGIEAEIIAPSPLFGRIRFAGAFVAKWLGYIDKFVFFPGRLKRRVARGVDLVHICDHSNALYTRWITACPVVVTCHDLIAVRGALHEVPDTPASLTGKYLQRWILSGLAKTDAVACISNATLLDAQRLVRQKNDRPRFLLIHPGLNYPYRKQPRELANRALDRIPGLTSDRLFVLHVGSNSRVKNREGVLRVFALTKDEWKGQLVFAGAKLTPELRSLGEELGIRERIVEIANPDNQLLEALYSSALALLYPSRYEGFGWPIIEAQACGCPVICADREPMSEAGGEAALRANVADEPAMARAVLRLNNPVERAQWSEKSLRNAERFQAEKMISEYIALYRALGAEA